MITVSSNDLLEMTLEELQALASRIGVGYAGLNQASLLERIVLEGEPVA
jgi:hypothetical protein